MTHNLNRYPTAKLRQILADDTAGNYPFDQDLVDAAAEELDAREQEAFELQGGMGIRP
jgi:hypothetical protein